MENTEVKEEKPTDSCENENVGEDQNHDIAKENPISVASCPSSNQSSDKKSRPATLKLAHVEGRNAKCDNNLVIQTVRNKVDRAKLEAYDCSKCAAYYKSLNLTDEQMKEKLHKCSRHRGTTGKVTGSSTPPGFWDVKMPTTPEAIEQGMVKIGTVGKDVFEQLGFQKGDVLKRSKLKRKSDETLVGSQTSPSKPAGERSPISSRKSRRSSLSDAV